MTKISRELYDAALAVQDEAARSLRVDRSLFFATRRVADPELVSVPTRHGDVACRIFRPSPGAPLSRGGTPPVVLQIHGGAFLIRVPEQDDHLNQYIASEVGAVVVSPDYTVAPQGQYPQGEEECFDVARWIVASGAERGWDGGRLAIGGTSAGAKHSCSVVQLAHRDNAFRARALVLGSSVLNMRRDDRPALSATPIINEAMQKLALAAWIPDVERRREPLASPYHDADLAAAAPPTLILSGGLDTLGPEADDVARRLATDGVTVTHRRFLRSDHGFYHFPPVEVAREAIELIGRYYLAYL